MYPHVTQFETRDLRVRQELELRRARQRAAESTQPKARRRRLALRPTVLMHRADQM